jgi:hypothetical protein
LRRFKIKLTDESGIEIGIVLAEFIVCAESPAEAEMYLRQSFPQASATIWNIHTTEIITAD